MRVSLTQRMRDLECLHSGGRYTATELANRMNVTQKAARSAANCLVDQGILVKGKRESHRSTDGVEYRMAGSATASKWLKTKWLRHTGMRITREFREDRGDFLR